MNPPIFERGELLRCEYVVEIYALSTTTRNLCIIKQDELVIYLGHISHEVAHRLFNAQGDAEVFSTRVGCVMIPGSASILKHLEEVDDARP